MNIFEDSNNPKNDLELSPEAEEILSSFKDFVGSNFDLIEDKIRVGVDPVGIFHEFCVDDTSRGLSPEERRETASAYIGSFMDFLDRWEEADHTNVWKKEHDGWLHFFVNGGMTKNSSIGRLYVNSKEEKTPEVAERIILECGEKGVTCNIKIPSLSKSNKINPKNLFRSDKMVIYFDINDVAGRGKLKSVIKDVYSDTPDNFNSKVPLFSKPINNIEDVSSIRGLSFGQEPGIKGKSFIEIRAEIFVRMFAELRNSISRTSFDYADSYRRWCKYYSVAADEPWHNIVEKKEVI